MNSMPNRQKIFADRARFHFYPGNNRLKDMDAEGAVRVEYERASTSAGQEVPEGFRTSSDSLKAVFVPDSESIRLASASQWGNFKYEDAARKATSGRCDYDAIEETMVLSDSPEIFFEMGSATGDTVEFDRRQRVLLILGNVRSILSKIKEAGFLGTSSASSSIILSEAMRYNTESGDARYSKNVQLLSEAHQLQAETLDILDAGAEIEAEGNIRHLFYSDSGNGNNSSSNSAPKEAGNSQDVPIYIKSSRLKYIKDTNTVIYSGNVSMSSLDRGLTSGTLEALLDEDGKDIVQAAARETVVVHKGNMQCKGDVAYYYSDPKRYEVTGSPAECFDPERGRFFPRRLTYNDADDSIQLESY